MAESRIRIIETTSTTSTTTTMTTLSTVRTKIMPSIPVVAPVNSLNLLSPLNLQTQVPSSLRIKDEIELVVVCQKIKQELVRLEKNRNADSLTTYSTKNKIFVLQKLLETLITPDQVPNKSMRIFGGCEITLINASNIDNLQSRSISTELKQNALHFQKPILFKTKSGFSIFGNPPDNHLWTLTPIKIQSENDEKTLNALFNFNSSSATLKNDNPLLTPQLRNQLSVGHAMLNQKELVRFGEFFENFSHLPFSNKKTNNTVLEKHETCFYSNEGRSFFIKLLQDHANLPIYRTPFPFEKIDAAGSLSKSKKFIIDQLVFFGDSLSDDKLMRSSTFGDFAGIKGNSPHGSFTNGYTWMHHLTNYLPQIAITRALKKSTSKSEKITKALNSKSADISDEILFRTHSTEFKYNLKKLSQQKIIDECDVYTFNDETFALSYAVGGATAYNFKGDYTGGLKVFTKQIVTNLDEERDRFLRDAERYELKNKNKILFIDWIGPNDLITVSDTPTFKAADLVVEARLKHYEKMIKQGYTHFVILNLPDLSLTPRFQEKTDAEQKEAKKIIEHLNQQLSTKIVELKHRHPECNLDICDINQPFQRGIHSIIKQTKNIDDKDKKLITHLNKLQLKEQPVSEKTEIRHAKLNFQDINKYINREYIFCYVAKLSSLTQESYQGTVFYFSIDYDKNKDDKMNRIVYSVEDRCGQIIPDNKTTQTYYINNSITYQNLIDKIGQLFAGLSSQDKITINQHFWAELNDLSNNKAIQPGGVLERCILAITGQRGHTLSDIDNPFESLKSSTAFLEYEKKLNAENKSIEDDIRKLSGKNTLFFDDVHPSADMHVFLFEIIKEFIEKKYQFNPPKATEFNESIKQLKKPLSHDDFNISYLRCNNRWKNFAFKGFKDASAIFSSKKTKLTNKNTESLSSIATTLTVNIKKQPSKKAYTQEELTLIFLREYLYKFHKQKMGFFGDWRESNLNWENPKNLTLAKIVKLAMNQEYGAGERTRTVLEKILNKLEARNNKNKDHNVNWDHKRNANATPTPKSIDQRVHDLLTMEDRALFNNEFRGFFSLRYQ